PLADGALLPHTVAAALRIREEPSRPLMETLVRELRSRSTLLVLDNCEHLLDACAGLAEALLRGCRDVRILVTSRQPLGIAGEITLRVPCLASPDPGQIPPEAEDSVSILAGYAALRLFIERASLARPGWHANRRNVRAVAQVCHRLDGNPLAIELAAAR